MAEATEGLWMTAKERDRLKVLHEVNKRHIPQKQAAAELGLSVRWVRQLLVRWRARGEGALRHGLRGRGSNRKTPAAVKRQVVALYRSGLEVAGASPRDTCEAAQCNRVTRRDA